MQRNPISSSRIASVGWENDVLEVEFHNGSVYQYYGVSRTEYISFMNSPSRGSALSKIDKIHNYTRIG